MARGPRRWPGMPAQGCSLPPMAQCQWAGVWGWSLISSVGRKGTHLHLLMLQWGWCHPSWKVPPLSARVCVQSGLSQVCFWCWSGFSRTLKLAEKASCQLWPSWAVCLLLLCFRLCVFSQIYFVASLETCIKYTEKGKTLCEKRRKGFRFGSCVCHCPLLGSALPLSSVLDLLGSRVNGYWILGYLTRSLLLWCFLSLNCLDLSRDRDLCQEDFAVTGTVE